MMELRHIAMVNWHLFEVEDIPISGHVGVFGENASGKSTILDMIQVVLTGANKNLLRLNSVANESAKGRSASRRSVVDYCLGALGENDRKRDPARTYISLGFVDSEGVRPPVSIGMAMEARRSESNETVLGRFVVQGRILTTADFIENRDGKRFPSEWDDVRKKIVSMVGAENFKSHRDKAVDYVREYMRLLVPTASVVGEQNANALQKTIVNAMTLDHEQSATDFVRNYILEKNDINVGELRESIRTYRSISDTIRMMHDKLEVLRLLRHVLDGLADAYDRKARWQWIQRRSEWLTSRASNKAMAAKLKDETAKRDVAKSEMDFLDEELRGIDAEISRLNVAIAEHNARTGRNSLDAALQTAEDDIARSVASFNRRIHSVGALQPLNVMSGFGFDEFIPYVSALTKAAKLTSVASIGAELLDAEKALIECDRSFVDKVDEARQSLMRRADEAKSKYTKLKERLSEHAGGGTAVHIDEPTRRLCQSLRQAGMVPRVLCDLVEVTDPAWLAAVEGLLGRDREAVFVDRKDIAEATALFKAGRREFRGASLVSLNKLEEFRSPPKPGSFPTVFRTSDPDAMAFLIRRYGGVRLALTIDQFNEPGRALMQDGLYDDGLIRSHRAADPQNFKIGKTAQKHALHAMAEESEVLMLEVQKFTAAFKFADQALVKLQEVVDASGVSFASISAEYTRANVVKAEVQERIAALSASDDGGLSAKRAEQTKLKNLRRDQRKAQAEIHGKHDKAAAILRHQLEQGNESVGSRLNVIMQWRLYSKIRPLYAPLAGRSAHRAQFEATAKKSVIDGHKSVSEASSSNVSKAETDLARHEREVRELMHTYSQKFTNPSQVGIESNPLNEIRPWMTALIDEIETNELRRYQEQADNAAKTAVLLLRGQFINALTSRVSTMERELASINRSLNEHPFHGERYSFHHTRLETYQPILRIIEIAKTSPDALDMLFKGDDIPEDFPYRDTLREIKALLEDPERDFTEFEDYRKYFTFEINITNLKTGRIARWEKRRGIASGGEHQAPIYVVIGASLASVYGRSTTGTGKPIGMAPAIFDEAFSKMDGPNKRQMMSFYNKLGLQVIIAAPTDKRTSVMEHIDSVIEVDRIDDSTRTSVIGLHERARREILAMDPATMSDEEVQRISAV